MTPRSALWVLIIVSGTIRLALSASLGLGNDEAYHYLFLVHPAWSYFDHPPMLAVVERLGVALAGGSVSAASLRLGFIVLFAGSTWLMARLTSRFYGARAGFLAALALNATAYHSVAAATFALPDGPLLFFWLLTLDRLAAAFESPAATRPWVGVGLAWGGAMLSKYHAVFLPLGALLFVVLEPTARSCLKRPGPYLAMALGWLVFSPVIAWNAAHGWASFAFQGGRALGTSGFRPETLAAAVLGQALYLFPWIWASLVMILVRRARRLSTPENSPGERFLIAQAIVPLAVFLAVACTRAVLPHWTLVAFLSLFPMLGRGWERHSWRQLALLAALPPLIAALVVVQEQTGLLQRGGPGARGFLRVSRDPTVDLYGWDEVGRELRRRGLLDQPGTFLFTSAWYQSGHLAFAVRGSATPVLCYNSWDARSFSCWSKPGEWLGQDGILVSLNSQAAEPHCFDRYFARIEPIGSFSVVRGRIAVRKVRLFRCVKQVVPFPFDGFQWSPTSRERARREGFVDLGIPSERAGDRFKRHRRLCHVQ